MEFLYKLCAISEKICSELLVEYELLKTEY